MAHYRIGLTQPDVDAAAKLSSAKVVKAILQGAFVIVETSEDLTEAEQEALGVAIRSAPTKTSEEPRATGE